MRIVHLLVVLLSIMACMPKENKKYEEVFGVNSKARWITDGRPLPEADSLFYLDHPAPVFRKEFESNRAVKNARFNITAAGYYIASINGQRIGKNVLDPAWTDYSKRIYYTTYDVTSLLNNGANCIGVILGNGFYNPLPLRKWGRRNLREDLTIGKPTVLAQLIITYDNGQTEEIVTDKSWKYSFGPIMRNSVYIGVAYDASREIDIWDTPGFDDQSWDNAFDGDDPKGQLQKAFPPPCRSLPRSPL